MKKCLSVILAIILITCLFSGLAETKIVVSGSGMFKATTDTSFADVAEGSDTIVVFKEDDIDKRNKLYKKVCETGIVFQCKKQSPAEIKKVLAYEVKKSGRLISEYVLQYMQFPLYRWMPPQSYTLPQNTDEEALYSFPDHL